MASIITKVIRVIRYTIRLTEEFDTKAHDGRDGLARIVIFDKLQRHPELLSGRGCSPCRINGLTGQLVGTFGRQLGVMPKNTFKMLNVKKNEEQENLKERGKF